MRYFEIATLSGPLLARGEIARGARAWVEAPEARGVHLGTWYTDIGELGRILVLRGFADDDEFARERQRARRAANPFNASPTSTGLAMDGYAPFPFLAPVARGPHGAVYEFRTYRLKPDGLSPTLRGWERAIGPARAYTAHLVTAMYALDGPTRITHVWAFASLEERSRLREQAYAAGVWPPEGGPENIVQAWSTIALPL